MEHPKLLFGDGAYIERMSSMTPDFAAQLLLRLHPNQRRLRKPYVATLARAMAEGRWRWTGDSFKLDQELRVIDGQHRLAAIVASGVSMRDALIAVVPGNDTLQFIDQGIVRTVNDVRATRGQGGVDASLSAAIAAESVNWEDWHGLSRDERLRLYDAMPFHTEMLHLRKLCGHRGRIWNAGPLGAAIRCMRMNREAATEFFSATYSGRFKVYGVKDCPQSKLLHETLLSRRARACTVEETRAVAVKAIRAYNAWRDCHTPQYLRYIEGSAIPEVAK